LKKKRIVIKVGTSTLTHYGRGMNFRSIEKLLRTIIDIKNAGNEVVLVTSGAIATGCVKLHMKERPRELPVKQAVAAVGQCELMHIYDKFFSEYGAALGQILLTRDDVERPKGKENLINTFEALLHMEVIPVVNENDSVAFDEIEDEDHTFGDNDTLSAVVAVLVGADMLILLSDIDGLYDSDPHINPDAKLLSVVDEIDDTIRGLAGGEGSEFGTGGMVTKIEAAQIATENGIDMYIINGADPEGMYKIVEGKQVGTLFRRKELKK
jgi:glutamate 5-kinase